jgi:hypothetical protein
MSYRSHAHLKPTATPGRIKALVRELEFYGCTVHIHYGARRIDFEVAERMERWILLGGLARMLGGYRDVLYWHPNFIQDESPHGQLPNAYRHSKIRH